MKLDREQLAALSRRYPGCLCRSCLASLAQAPAE
jgi:hypothetical protein